MQTTQRLEDVTILHDSTSYELITKWIDKGYTLGLSANALQVMTVLLRFYNPHKKFVFPRQETIAERTNTSVASVKRALNELMKANLIIKRRTQRGNVYGFTGSLFELLDSSNCTVGIAQFEPCMNNPINEHNKEHHHEEQKQIKADDDFQTNSSSKRKHVRLEDVPQHLRDNPKVKDPCAYWASLTSEERNQQLAKAEEIERKKIISFEKKRKAKEAEELEKEQKRKELEEKSKPIEERYSYESACTQILTLARINRRCAFGGLAKELAETFNIDVEELLMKSL